MPIRYCTATSKRTHQPYRARAMIGRNVCYHHGGKSRRGTQHPNFKHGYYSTDWYIQLVWTISQNAYRRAAHQLRIEEIVHELSATMPRKTRAVHRRLMAACRAAVAQMPQDRITPDMIGEVFEGMKERWPWLDR